MAVVVAVADGEHSGHGHGHVYDHDHGHGLAAANTVSREQVAAFAGSIAGAKGVFLTTSTFSRQAVDFVMAKHRNIVLVDGQGVGDPMLRCGLGVSVKRTYESLAIDEDFFTDDE